MCRARQACVVLVAVAALAQGGCHKTFRGTVTQPNPLVFPHETLRDSERVTIITGDMELLLPRYRGPSGGGVLKNRRYPLRNVASFTVVSRDRMRFHVQIEHKWREWADVTTWNAHLVDDKGRQYRPERVEKTSDRHIVYMWDYETRSVVRNAHGDAIGIANDGYKNRQPLGNLSVFRGRGDFVFYSRDLFTPDVKQVTLVVERTGVAFVFRWNFQDATEALQDAEELAIWGEPEF